ncbi:glycosyltransferase family 4 protein [Brevundimonas mediterranea]|uniref:Glycosyltransferase involved in cell wall biosynthesis n=1 Tax=Brevundimonas mediterranea TaxID=74329 RepID=A0A7W6F0M5_9CAUL|nr:glycosyltransferase family 4 protein [Brevundimonas mediterranea]MBB3872953.1 glycosyltransferase involved in cell wall biosynthesis [Brevundimonas mediterranea]
MRILVCTNAYPPRFMGGAELVAHEQAKSLVTLGHEVLVFAGGIVGRGPRHSRTDEFYDGLPVVRIETTEEDYSPAYINFLHPAIEDHFRNVLKSFRPDVVHFHNIIGLSVRLPILAKRAGIRTVCTLHDFWGFCQQNTGVRRDGEACDASLPCASCVPRIHDGRGLHVPLRLRRDMVRFCFEHLDHLIAPSRYVAARYAAAELVGDDVHIIPNGVQKLDSQQSDKPSKSRTRIAYIGYFGQHKGVATLLSAMAQVVTDFDIELLLAGEGPEQDNYRKQAEALGILGRVRFLGKVPHEDIASVYSEADIVCLPSVWDENQPVCLMEAMSAGRPVIASRKGGIPEIVEHGRNGFLFKAGDAQELATYLSVLCGDKKLRVEMGNRGRDQVMRQTYEDQARFNLDVYGAPPRTWRIDPRVVVFGSLRFKPSSRDAGMFADQRHRRKIFLPFAWRAESVFCADYAWLILPRWAGLLTSLPFLKSPILLRLHGFRRGRQLRHKGKAL